jgi:hypothetical protein
MSNIHFVKNKILNLILVLTSLIGYLEWGNNQRFLFQVEGEILSKLFSDPVSVLHPFTILPLAGQIILIITLFQKKPGKALTLIGIAALGLLLGLMFFIGIIDVNWKILLSTIPFWLVAVITIRHHLKSRDKTGEAGETV